MQEAAIIGVARRYGTHGEVFFINKEAALGANISARSVPDPRKKKLFALARS